MGGFFPFSVHGFFQLVKAGLVLGLFGGTAKFVGDQVGSLKPVFVQRSVLIDQHCVVVISLELYSCERRPSCSHCWRSRFRQEPGKLKRHDILVVQFSMVP